MKQTANRFALLALSLLLILALAACERPAPREEVPSEGETLPQPTIIIPTTEPAQPAPDQGYPAPAGEEGAAPTDQAPAGTEQPAEGAGQPAEQPAPGEPAATDPGQTETAPPTDSQPAEPATNAQGEPIHIVQAGENLYRIGLRYGVTYEELGAYNGIPAPYIIYVGQELRIPPGG